MAESFMVHSAPLRIGLLFVTPPPPVSGFESASVALMNVFNFISEKKNPKEALTFITDVYALIKGQDRDVEVEDVKKKLSAKDIETVLGSESDYSTGRQLAADFLSRSGFTTFPQALMNGVPLPENSLTMEGFEDAVLNEIMVQTTFFQKEAYKGKLTDADNVVDYVMSRPNVMPRLNARILKQENSRYLDLMKVKNIDEILSKMAYTQLSKGTSLMTYWIVGDFRNAKARDVLSNALEHMDATSDGRLSIIINSDESASDSQENSINKILLGALLSNVDLRDVLKDFSKSDNSGKDTKDYGIKDDVWPRVNELMDLHASFCKHTLQFSVSDVGLVVNGRVIGPFNPREEFLISDFTLLDRHAYHTYIDAIHTTVKFSLDRCEEKEKSNVFMKLVSVLTSRPSSAFSRVEFPPVLENHSVVRIPARSDQEPVFDVRVVVDPVSKGAQKIGPILSTLQKVINAEIKIYLNAAEKHSDMPLKSYYRFVLEPELAFTEEGSLANLPIAYFTGVSRTSLLTQNMQTPENWLVESIMAPYDLDNIILKDIGGVVYSQFELEHLLLEGHCYDKMFHAPPRGLQITLGTETNPVIVDTIVMANLGYFQLKASPGVWVLRLRQGRSSDIYEIVSYEGVDSLPSTDGDIKVLVGSFQSQILKLKVKKKPGKIHEQLLDDEESTSSGIWNSIANTFSSKTETQEEEAINVYSVASGHLYERFLKIMMLSVIKHTKSPVKFWFLKNYLSPTFKSFLPRMAQKYNFKYELVQYKWPRWLHQQTEKQRIIWGYKILFLDVLFPLDVKKIIFVDADQVVRADLKELVELDLQGAPYGYTPFCDSRKEMDGFRFWNQGYWKAHLQGRKYHISALYVVDLKRFRKIAAGDRLRGQYQALSQDPNSLSNLDQDLPNNMIHQVAIKSLPQDWLWCETWCNNESKPKAKTIDLCNNPLTKEAKLTAAMRIIEEWKDYDEELKRVQLGLDEPPTEEETEEDRQKYHQHQQEQLKEASDSHTEL